MTCTAARHGTRGAYLAGCRCPEARAANTAYARARARRNLQARYGAAPPLSVPVQQAVDIINALVARGWTRRRIGDISGIGRDRLSRITNGTRRPIRRVHWSTYTALRDLLDQPVPVAPGTLVDATGTWRRLEALIAIGWPKTTLARRLGVGRALQFPRDRVQARTAEKVRALYAELAWTPGPSDTARLYAKRHRFLTPSWWDDEALDDPAAQPDVTERQPRSAALAEDARWLLDNAVSLTETAARLGISEAYLLALLHGTKGAARRERGAA